MSGVALLYPDQKQWRLHFDMSSAGYTTIAMSPILGEKSCDLSPKNLWRIGHWHGKEKTFLAVWLHTSNFKQVVEFQQTHGSIVIISDWEGLRCCTNADRPCSQSQSARACSFCDIPKHKMKQLYTMDTKVADSDMLKGVLPVTARVPCVFHGMRVFISWIWQSSLDTGKTLAHGAVS